MLLFSRRDESDLESGEIDGELLPVEADAGEQKRSAFFHEL